MMDGETVEDSGQPDVQWIVRERLGPFPDFSDPISSDQKSDRLC